MSSQIDPWTSGPRDQHFWTLSLFSREGLQPDALPASPYYGQHGVHAAGPLPVWTLWAPLEPEQPMLTTPTSTYQGNDSGQAHIHLREHGAIPPEQPGSLPALASDWNRVSAGVREESAAANAAAAPGSETQVRPDHNYADQHAQSSASLSAPTACMTTDEVQRQPSSQLLQAGAYQAAQHAAHAMRILPLSAAPGAQQPFAAQHSGQVGTGQPGSWQAFPAQVQPSYNVPHGHYNTWVQCSAAVMQPQPAGFHWGMLSREGLLSPPAAHALATCIQAEHTAAKAHAQLQMAFAAVAERWRLLQPAADLGMQQVAERMRDVIHAQARAAGGAPGQLVVRPGQWELASGAGRLSGHGRVALLSHQPTDGLPPLQQAPAAADLPSPVKRKVRRARLVKDGTLTMIIYGADEALKWAKRVGQFTSTVRHVLGDRKLNFHWRGSVLDSVVGAFLTQNVSDALSSKAFMTLTATFPAQCNAWPAAVAAATDIADQLAEQVEEQLEQQEQPEVTADGLSTPQVSEKDSLQQQTDADCPDSSTHVSPSPADTGIPTALGSPSRGDVSIEFDTADGIDWAAVATAAPEALADAIKCRGMQQKLTIHIQGLLRLLQFPDGMPTGQKAALSTPEPAGMSEDAQPGQQSAPALQQHASALVTLTAASQASQTCLEVTVSDMAGRETGAPEQAAGPAQEAVSQGSDTACFRVEHASASAAGRSACEDSCAERLMDASMTHAPMAHDSALTAADISLRSAAGCLPDGATGAVSMGPVPGLRLVGPGPGTAYRVPPVLLTQEPATPTHAESDAASQESCTTMVAGSELPGPFRGQGAYVGAANDSPRDCLASSASGTDAAALETPPSTQSMGQAGSAAASMSSPGGGMETAAASSPPAEAAQAALRQNQAALHNGAISQGANQDLPGLGLHALAKAKELRGCLEWLREPSVTADQAREYLMNITGLGRKSVACILLLALRKKDFPVDTNVGRIAARLGWLPIDSEAALEDLDEYAPEPEVHKYLHSRLMRFDVDTLYELHYQMITLGKVFCTKRTPNCSACPLQGMCEYAQSGGARLRTGPAGARQDQTASHPVRARPSNQPSHRLPPRGSTQVDTSRHAAASSTASEQPIPDIEDLSTMPATAAGPSGNAAPSPAAADLREGIADVVPAHGLNHEADAAPDHEGRQSGSSPAQTGRPDAAMDAHAMASGPSTTPGDATVPGGQMPAFEMQPLSDQDSEVERIVQAGQNLQGLRSESDGFVPDSAEEEECDARLYSAALTVLAVKAAECAAGTCKTPACESPALAGPVAPVPAAAIKRRFRELSVLCHPDKCSHPGAEKAFGVLRDAQNIALQHAEQSALPAGEPEAANPVDAQADAGAEQMPGKHSRRLHLFREAVELPLHLLPLHLQQLYDHCQDSPACLGLLLDETPEPPAMPLTPGKADTPAVTGAVSGLRLASGSASGLIAAEQPRPEQRDTQDYVPGMDAGIGCHATAAPGCQDTAAGAPYYESAPDQPCCCHAGDGAVSTCQVSAGGHTDSNSGTGPLDSTVPRCSPRSCAQPLAPCLHSPVGPPAAQCGDQSQESTSGRQEAPSSPPTHCCSPPLAGCAALPACRDAEGRQSCPGATSAPPAVESSSPDQRPATPGCNGLPSSGTGPHAADSSPRSPAGEQEACAAAGQADCTTIEEPLVRMAVLVPCRLALGGRFPLNGTYFQVNEVFLDHTSLAAPLQVPAALVAAGSLRTRHVYFGQSISSICRGLTQREVAGLFKQGRICVRAYDPASGAPLGLPVHLVAKAPAAAVQKRSMKAPPGTGTPPTKKAAVKSKSPVTPLPGGIARPRLSHAFTGSGAPSVLHSRRALFSLPGDELRLPAAPQQKPERKRKAVSAGGDAPLHKPSAAAGSDANQEGSRRKRMQHFANIPASRRCGTCKTCLNPSMKKACLTRRAEMARMLAAEEQAQQAQQAPQEAAQWCRGAVGVEGSQQHVAEAAMHMDSAALVMAQAGYEQLRDTIAGGSDTPAAQGALHTQVLGDRAAAAPLAEQTCFVTGMGCQQEPTLVPAVAPRMAIPAA